MLFSENFVRLDRECTRHEAWYRGVASAHPVLAQYPTPSRVVQALGLPCTLSLTERNALLVALVRAHRASPHPVWQAILLKAFEPMLVRLRNRARGASGAELDQQIFLRFADAVAQVGEAGDSDRISMRLRQATERALFGGLNRQRATDELHAGWRVHPETVAIEAALGPPVALPSDPQTQAMCHALERGELRALIRQAYPDAAGREFERIYRRLQQRRHRLFRALRSKARVTTRRLQHSSQRSRP